jgi:DNA modification methylase
MVRTDIKPLPGDNTPRASLIYGTTVEGAGLEDSSVHAIITELPVPGFGSGPASSWPSIKYSPTPSSPSMKVPAEDVTFGEEETVEGYIAHAVHAFRELRRVLRPDGTAWVHVRDRYVENKQLALIPHQVALALQADGWILRNEVIWQRDNASPESAKDRLTRTHGTLFLLAHPDSGGAYFYDPDSIREPHKSMDEKHIKGYNKDTNMADGYSRRPELDKAWHPKGRNRRTVWPVNLGAYLGKSVSPWPQALVDTMVRASCSGGGVCSECGAQLVRQTDDSWIFDCDHEGSGVSRPWVLDPFSGTAVTGKAALDWGANYIGVDIDIEVLPEGRARLEGLTHSRKVLQQKGSPILEMFGDV